MLALARIEAQRLGSTPMQRMRNACLTLIFVIFRLENLSNLTHTQVPEIFQNLHKFIWVHGGYKKCLNLYFILIITATRNKHLSSRRFALSHQTSQLTSTPGNDIFLHPLCWYSSKYASLSYCEFSPTKAGFESQTKRSRMHRGIYPFVSGRGGTSVRRRLCVVVP